MIAYLDTSAFVPLLVLEPTSAACRSVWEDADDLVSSRLLYVETAAALAQARRLDRLNDVGHARSVELLDRMFAEIDIVEVDDKVVAKAAKHAYKFALRGYDAVHCASAEALNDPELVAASGDRRLIAAWTQLHLATFDTLGPRNN